MIPLIDPHHVVKAREGIGGILSHVGQVPMSFHEELKRLGNLIQHTVEGGNGRQLKGGIHFNRVEALRIIFEAMIGLDRRWIERPTQSSEEKPEVPRWILPMAVLYQVTGASPSLCAHQNKMERSDLQYDHGRLGYARSLFNSMSLLCGLRLDVKFNRDGLP